MTLTLACAVSAGSPPWRGPGVIKGSGGEQVCAKHHETLRRETVFGPGNGICVLVQPSKAMARQLARSPNALPIGIHRQQNQLYSRAVEVLYCARCEDEVQAAGKRRK
jgi:hypothetical protein